MQFGPILRAMSRNKVRFGLLLFEIALSLAIVVNSVTLLTSSAEQIDKPSGFADDELLRVRAAPFEPAFRDQAYFDSVVDRDFEALRRIPGVKAVTSTYFLPWSGGGSSGEVRPLGSKGGNLRTQMYNADAHTFEVLGTNIIAGQGFNDEGVARETRSLRELLEKAREKNPDGKQKEPYVEEVVLSRAFATLAFGDAQPIDKMIGKMLEDPDGDQYRVIGLIDNFYNPYGWPIGDYALFYGARSHKYENGVSYLVRADREAIDSVRGSLESVLLGVDPGRALTTKTILETKASFQSSDVIVVRVLYVVIVLVVFLTFIGIVGLTSFSVTERTRQIGTRRALGARQIDILVHFLLENWLVTTMGILVGVPLTIGLNIAVLSNTEGAKVGPAAIVLACLLFWTAGLAATFFPALRGARIPPATATRNV